MLGAALARFRGTAAAGPRRDTDVSARAGAPRSAARSRRSGPEQPGQSNPRVPDRGLEAGPVLRTGQHSGQWGRSFGATVRQAGEAACRRHGVRASWPSSQQLRVGTDCSGAEAPIWALKALGLQHQHVFSCDIDPRVRKFISATCRPSGPLYEDMLRRDRDSLPDHSVYVCGFPCKPFSSLRHHSTRLLKEPTAKPFFECLRVLASKRPALAVLENVKGITAVLDTVLKYLRRVKGYFIIVMEIDCLKMGEPVSRPRFYFILVRQDAAASQDLQVLADIAKDMYAAACAPLRCHVADRMLPSSSPIVQAYLDKRARRAPQLGTPQ